SGEDGRGSGEPTAGCPFESLRPIGENKRRRSLHEIAVDSLFELVVGSVGGSEMAAPVRTAAVGVGESILVRECPRTENPPGFLLDLAVGSEWGDGAPHEQRRFRVQEVRILLSRLAPVVSADSD